MTAIRRSVSAENVRFDPAGTIAATNVQDAIEEVASEAGTGGGGGGGVRTSFFLDSSTSIGGTSFVLDGTTDINVGVGTTLLVSAYTTRAELLAVTSIASATIGCAAMRQAHTAGDIILVIQPEDYVTPPMFGCAGGTTDDYLPLQRAILETTNLIRRLGFTAGITGAMFRSSVPVGVPSSSQWRDIGIKTHSSFTMTDPDGALVMLSQTGVLVTGTASTNVLSGISTSGPGGYSEVNHTKIMFNAPYGETLPGGITAGKVYYIRTTPTTSTFTISATRGGAELDITSDGTAWAYHMIDELSRVYWNDIRIEVGIADVNGVLLNLQQPAYVRNIRLEMNTICTVRTYGMIVGGQIGYIDNIEAVPNYNCTGVLVTGSGIRIRGLNSTGHGNGTGAVGIEFNSCDNGGVSDLWTESVDVGVLISSGRGISIGPGWLAAPASSTAPALKVASATASYDCGNLRLGSGGYRVLEDTERGIILNSYGATDANSCTDETYMCPGFSQLGTIGFLFDMPPKFKNRNTVWVIANYSAKYIDENINVSSNTGSRTITLPTAVGWIGHQFRIGHYEFSGANTCTVVPAGGQNIDGAANLVIPQGGTATLVSDGGQWQISAERA